MKHVLITGGAGFIGSRLIRRILMEGEYKVTCIDNFDPFYPTIIKKKNIQPYHENPNYKFVKVDIRNMPKLREKLTDNYDVIVHLAAKAGVRPSIKDPLTYQQVNTIGTQNLLEFAKEREIKQFVFASSSSVYGVNENVPWEESDRLLLPISPYAATKLSSELIGHYYSHIYNIRFLALRFFTVYGPGQRPDLAIHKFFGKILTDKPISMFGDGSTYRDYTYSWDILAGVIAAMKYEDSMYEIINLGRGQTTSLKDLIANIEEIVGQKAKIRKFPQQPGDVPRTYASIDKAKSLLSYDPKTEVPEGLVNFYQWMQERDILNYVESYD